MRFKNVSLYEVKAKERKKERKKRKERKKIMKLKRSLVTFMLH